MRLRLTPSVRKNLILEAAWTVALRLQTTEGLTLDEVATAANVSHGTVARYFKLNMLIREVLLRARRAAYWHMMREALPGSRYHNLIKLKKDETLAITRATILNKR